MIELMGKQGFRLIEEIAESSRVVTWKAVQTSLNRAVAIIILKSDPVPTPEELERFLSIARIYARIKCPAIPSVFDIVDTPDLHYIVTDAVTGEDLDTLVEKNGPFPMKAALRIALSISEGLDALWSTAQIVHRNIKGSNICLSPANGAKIRQLSHAIRGGPNVDATAGDGGLVVGTPSYLSPEQASGSHTLTTQSDMYALGCLLYRLTTGIEPFAVLQDPVQILTQQVQGRLPPPDTITPRVTGNFSWLLHRMMMKAAEDRYRTWKDFQRDVEAILTDGQPSCVRSDETHPSTIDVSLIGSVKFVSDAPTADKKDDGNPQKTFLDSPLFKNQPSRTHELFLWIALGLWFVSLSWYLIMPEEETAVIKDNIVDPLKEKVVPIKEKILEKVPLAPIGKVALKSEEPQASAPKAPEESTAAPAKKQLTPNTSTGPSPKTVGEKSPEPEAPQPTLDFSEKTQDRLARAFCDRDDPVLAVKRVLLVQPKRIAKRDKMIAQLERIPDIKNLTRREIEKDVGRKVQFSRNGKTITVTLRTVTDTTLFVEANGRGFAIPYTKIEANDLVRWIPDPETPEEALCISLFLLKSPSQRKNIQRCVEKCPLFKDVILQAVKMLDESSGK